MKNLIYIILILSIILVGCQSNSENEVVLDSTTGIEFKISELELDNEIVFNYNGQEAIVVKREDGVRVFYKKCPIHPNIPTYTTPTGHSCPHGTFDENGQGESGLPARVDYPMHEIPFKEEGNLIIIE